MKLRLVVMLMLGLGVAFSRAHPSKPMPPQPEVMGGRPIRVVVYTGPGGLIDITANRFVSLAKEISGLTFFKTNRPGAGGVVAFEEVLQGRKDGSVILAVTKSNLSKLMAANREDLIDQIDWFALVMEDPQSVIVPINETTGRPMSWPEIARDAARRRGRQLWVGPDIGGLDHVSALKIWRRAGIEARWVPYPSGGRAIAALLGGFGAVYVGNPGETLGKPRLAVAAICAPQRLKTFPDVPTFRELGIEGLEKETMWRGFALPPGVPAEVKNWYAELFRRVDAHPKWRQEWEPSGITVHLKMGDAFQNIVRQDREELHYYLKQIGLLRQVGSRQSLLAGIGEEPAIHFFTVTLLILNGVLFVFLLRSPFKHFSTELIILSGLVSLAIVFFVKSEVFPPPNMTDVVGPAGIPRLWILFLVPLALLQAWLLLREEKNDTIEVSAGIAMLMRLLLTLIVYTAAIPWLGYLIATAIFLPVALLVLGYQRPIWVIGLTASWLIFSFVVFEKLLHVDLPVGIWLR